MAESEVKTIVEEIGAEDRDLAKAKEDASKVKSMLNSLGWKEVVKPYLQSQRQNTLESVRDASELNQFFQIQQRASVIDELLNFIEVKLAEGVKAEEKENMTSE